MSISSLGYGGTNAHLVVKSHSKHMNNNLRRPHHRLVFASGRTEEALHYFLNEMQKKQDDQEFLTLLDEIHKMNIDGHYHRG